MLLDIGPPFFGFDRDCPYSRRSPAFLANRSLRPSLFPAILLAGIPPTPLLRAAMDGVSRLLVRGAGFRHTSPTGRRAGQWSGASSTTGRRRSTASRRRAPGHEISHWLPPPPDPQPSDRIVQISAMAARPLRCFCCYLQRNISYHPLRPGQTCPNYLARSRQKHIMRSWQFWRRQLCLRGAFVPIRR